MENIPKIVDELIIAVDKQNSENLVQAIHKSFLSLHKKGDKEGEFYYNADAKELRFKGPEDVFKKIGFHLCRK